MGGSGKRLFSLLYAGAALSFLMAATSFGILIYDHSRQSELIDIQRRAALWGGESGDARPVITPKSAKEDIETAEIPNNVGPVVASKKGKKFHHPDCPSAKRILPENLVTFETVGDAKAKGLSPSKSCAKMLVVKELK
ncbi:MAG: hypothetical protein Kow0090_07340 [Myxococcota bacterium]